MAPSSNSKGFQVVAVRGRTRYGAARPTNSPRCWIVGLRLSAPCSSNFCGMKRRIGHMPHRRTKTSPRYRPSGRRCCRCAVGVLRVSAGPRGTCNTYNTYNTLLGYCYGVRCPVPAKKNAPVLNWPNRCVRCCRCSKCHCRSHFWPHTFAQGAPSLRRRATGAPETHVPVVRPARQLWGPYGQTMGLGTTTNAQPGAHRPRPHPPTPVFLLPARTR